MPNWPQSNGMTERFMENLCKVIQIESVNGRSYIQALNEFLRSYRNAPHCTTQVTPNEMLFGRMIASKLPVTKQTPHVLHQKVRMNDKRGKDIMKNYAHDRRRACDRLFKVGDIVLLKNTPVRE